MSLINELQEIAETQDILTVLRKAKRVCGKLGRKGISDWIKNEMDGYDGNVFIPSYRTAYCVLCYNTNGYIPAGFGYLKSGMFPVGNFPQLDIPVRSPIGHFEEAVATNRQMYLPAPNEWMEKFVSNMSHEDLNRMTLHMQVPDIEAKRILNSVRDVVLDWAIMLEQQGITGDGQSFSSNEIAKAAQVEIHINQKNGNERDVNNTFQSN